MKIRYSLTWKEYWHLNRWRMRQSSRRDRAKCYGVFGSLLLLYALGLVMLAYRDPVILPVEARWPIVWIILIPFAYLISWLFEGIRLAIEIDENGIGFTRFIEHLRPLWKSITILDQDEESIYLSFNFRPFRLASTGLITVMIPKRAFTSPEDAERFYEQAQLYCREAGGQPRPVAIRTLNRPLAN